MTTRIKQHLAAVRKACELLSEIDTWGSEALTALNTIEAELDRPRTVWVLTQEHNEYDQHGEYFICAFGNKPTKEQLEKIGVQEDGADLDHVLSGGGRRAHEDIWYYLREHSVPSSKLPDVDLRKLAVATEERLASYGGDMALWSTEDVTNIIHEALKKAIGGV